MAIKSKVDNYALQLPKENLLVDFYVFMRADLFERLEIVGDQLGMLILFGESLSNSCQFEDPIVRTCDTNRLPSVKSNANVYFAF